MRVIVTFLFCFLILAPGAWAQDTILARADGYELKQSEIEPALAFLRFLAQSDIPESEIKSITGEFIEEFKAGPKELLGSLHDLETAYGTAKSTNDPLLVGEFRQKVIGELYKTVENTPANEVPTYVSFLFQKAPVVAIDSTTGAALTEPDLDASLNYIQQLQEFKGDPISNEDLATARAEIIAGFDELDEETQNMFASGTLLMGVYTGNFKAFTAEQQNATKSHYRDTVGGPPTDIKVRGPGDEDTSILAKLSRGAVDDHKALMESIEKQGGDDQYWSLQKKDQTK